MCSSVADGTDNVRQPKTTIPKKPGVPGPFDRLIITQARLLDARVITADDAFTRYEVSTIDPR